MASWEEVKRLAADFQKVQLSSTTQRLSERNCIEIVSWLIDRKLIDLIFTSDGKEYMTSSQLVQDILGELYIRGGRVNYVELSKTIGVDLSHITNHVPEVTRGRKDIYSILGQLIDTSYIIKIAGEINQKLIQQGQINIGDLTIQYDLPADFLQRNVVEKYLGKLIHGEQDKCDPKIFFTESFISRSRAKIRGALMALTKPTVVSVILNQIEVTDKLFFSLFDQLSTYGFLTGRTTSAQYVPNVYSRSQNEWVQNFFKQNGYLEFDALIRLGITDYKGYLKKHFANENVVTLKSSIISFQLIERIEADLEECISSKSFVDLQSSLPNLLDDEDIKIIIDKVVTGQRQRNIVILDNFLISKAFIDIMAKDCEGFLQDKVRDVVKSGSYQQYLTDLQVRTTKSSKCDDEEVKVDKREERRKKAASGKSGGGAQGRETKTKSTKKPTRIKNIQDDSDDYFEKTEKKVVLEVISASDVQKLIESKVEEEGLGEILESIVNYLLQVLNESGLEAAAKLYETTIADQTASRRHTHNDVQNKVNALLGDVRLFEKGLKCFPIEVQTHLYKYLLKTICLDIVNEILNYVASEKGLNVEAEKLTNEQRTKFINDLTPDYKNVLQNLLKTLSNQSVEEFTAAVEICLTECSMILKKIDKKKDKLVISNHKHALLEQLDKCDDSALTLHLASLIIFVTVTQNMLHASGRHVSSILTYLKQYLGADQFSELSSYHDLVTIMLNGGSEAESAKDQLKERMPSIKKIANEFKKSVSDKS
ncbi:hypothetical protein PPYR_05107 [Photinus pyralis]|uniref:E3 UFM1-protein ligase 1 homolog n=1 Tax=Photinus pyralis TaxID=7054 RepID=A0A1Y1MLH5_PHOPY|nr:E3 UFM1-protein ligase 1 homolog [Photinus pyralis]KAB0802921.1 hypothetical protein PPYR_05107 [Photinus pyralis]